MFLIPGMLTEFLPEKSRRAVKIVHDSPDMLTRLRAERGGQPLRASKYTRLLIKGAVWMTDAEFECATNRYIVRASRGHVLIAGLGLGLVLLPILAKRSVTKVTVLERNADVIALVAPHYANKKLAVVKADVFKWEPEASEKFDVIYFDIWPNVPNSDDRPTVDRLRRKYREHLKRGGWMGAWCEEFTR